MDSGGNIYNLDDKQLKDFEDEQKAVTLKNIETKMHKTFPPNTLERLKMIPESERDTVLQMNRKDRREWFRNNGI